MPPSFFLFRGVGERKKLVQSLLLFLAGKFPVAQPLRDLLAGERGDEMAEMEQSVVETDLLPVFPRDAEAEMYFDETAEGFADGYSVVLDIVGEGLKPFLGGREPLVQFLFGKIEQFIVSQHSVQDFAAVLVGDSGFRVVAFLVGAGACAVPLYLGMRSFNRVEF